MPPVKNVFDVLEDESEERGTRRAAIVAVARTKKQMGAFFKQAADEADFDARLSLVSDTISDIVREACVENSTSDFATVTRVVASELAHFAEVMRNTVQDTDIAPVTEDEEGDGQMHVRGLAGRKLLGLPSQLEENGGKIANGDGSFPGTPHGLDFGGLGATGGKCTCGPGYKDDNCAEHGEEATSAAKGGVGNLHKDGPETPLERAQRDAATKTAVETGDTYTQETVDLPKADESGLSDEPSGPSMDSASAGDENHTSQKPIDIPSTRHNPEVQDITDHADYTKALDTPSGVAKRVDADTPMQPEHHVAPDTQTWNGTKDQATPVTSKWKVIS